MSRQNYFRSSQMHPCPSFPKVYRIINVSWRYLKDPGYEHGGGTDKVHSLIMSDEGEYWTKTTQKEKQNKTTAKQKVGGGELH